MVQQHHAYGVHSRLGGETFRAHPGEIEARHDVGDDYYGVAINLAYSRFAVCRVGDGNDRVCVGMVNIGIRQDGVQNGLHRGNRRRSASLLRHQLIDHLWVGQCRQLRQFFQVLQSDRRKTCGSNRFQIPAAALDV